MAGVVRRLTVPRSARLGWVVLLSVGAGALLAGSAQADPFASTSSVDPRIQYLGDTNSSFVLTVDNTGDTDSIGAVQIARPGGAWTITGCPQAPAGWSRARSATMCRYTSAATTADDIAPGASASFEVRMTTTGGSQDRTGTWSVVVSRSNRFDTPSLLASAAASPGALDLTVHSFQVLDAVVTTGTATAGAACPSGDHSAGAGSTQTVVVCGRNRTNRTLTPVAAQASLGGTFVAASGTFSSGPVPRSAPNANVVLGTWTNVEISSSAGTGQTVLAAVGSASTATSPVTTLTGYEVLAPVDPPPVADAQSVSTDEDTPLAITLTGSDPDGQPITFNTPSSPSQGSLTGTAPNVTYDPEADSFGSDSFTFTVNDGTSDSAPATVSITVDPVNDAPTFTKGADQTVNVDAGAQTVSGWATAISVGPANEATQTAQFVASNDNPSLFSTQPAIATDGTLTFTPAAGTSGTATVSVSLVDDGGTTNGGDDTSDTQTFTISVVPVNATPTADATSASGNEDGGAIAVTLTGHDGDGDALTFSVGTATNGLVGVPGTITCTGTPSTCTTTVTYTPNASYFGSDSFTYKVNDGTVDSADATASITVNAVNDAPTAAAKSYTAQANMKIGLGGLLVGAADAADTGANPGYTPTFTVGSITAGAGCTGCTVSNIDATNGTFDFDPPAGGTGTFTLSYTVVDSGDPAPGVESAPQTITVTVNGPVIWFVDAAAAPGGTGRLSEPFSSLGGAAAVDAANHRIFLAPGTYADGIALLAGEWLAGAGAEAADFDTLMGITPPAGTTARPAVDTTAPVIQGAVTLGANDTLRGLTLSGSPALSGSSFGTLTLGSAADADVAVSTTGQALNLSTGTISGDLLSTVSSGGVDNVNLTSVSSTGTSLGTGALSNATNEGLQIVGGTGSFSYSGTIANAGTTTVAIANKTGGTVNLSGAISDAAGAGVALTSNPGATINLTGGVVLSSGASPAFSATGGGTISVTGAANTLTSTTGAALTIADTAIGAADVTFRSISSNGATHGILLSNTGTSGNLAVTGNGGTCTAADTSGCSGGVIQNTAGADSSSATPPGTGVVLHNTRDVALTRMHIHDNSNYGVRGTSVTNLTLVDSVVNGVNGTNSGAPFVEGSAIFDNLIGTVELTRVAVSGGFGSNIEITNTTGTLNSLFDAIRVGANSTSDGNDGLQVEGTGTATVNATIQASVFTSSRGDLIQYIGDGTGGGVLTITGNTLSNNHPAIATGGGGLSLFAGAAGPVTMNITNNTSRDAKGMAWLIVKSPGSGSITGTFSGNTIGVPAVANSGSLEGSGLELLHAGTGTMSWTVTNNNIHQYNGQGIMIQAGAGAVAGGTLNAAVSGNTLSSPGNNPSFSAATQGLHVNSGVTPGDSFTTCVDVGANTIGGSGRNGGTDFRVRQRQSTTVRLPGYGGAAGDTAAVVAFVQGKLGSPATGSAIAAFPTTGGGFVGASC